MKLQKLVYYSQAWSLVWDEDPLFQERIEAWANGPVVRELFAEHRGQFSVGEWPRGDVDHLTPDQRKSIDVVVDTYGKLTGKQLSEMTHNEDPWRKARAGLPAHVGSNAEISPDAMKEFYSSLLDRDDAETV
ncbi:Panacea domain-containing protein [Nocardiopsis sp. B62]|uniref:Panacea domain-containing protein n=1 Tax=Nocardiopsis sp. B62 TaxID=2824874 RepID=UPI001B358A91|nr:type II toxin-antitoxin system antitoxin SocA domain-containing protein [Nocardiopsis sp. B62]MBQ1081576.1 DUF4065 domain-containing protein [Nocardiopsis sp. B62]